MNTNWWTITPFLKGDKGDTGVTGSMPNHQWQGTSLRFQQSPTEWGNYVDLKGDTGEQGIPGSAGFEDIEQGNWTPIFRTDSDPTEPVYLGREGHFYRIKKMIFFSAGIAASSTAIGNGTLQIHGLPFVASPAGSWQANVTVSYYSGFTNFNGVLSAMCWQWNQFLHLFINEVGQFPQRSATKQILSESFTIFVGGSYISI